MDKNKVRLLGGGGERTAVLEGGGALHLRAGLEAGLDFCANVMGPARPGSVSSAPFPSAKVAWESGSLPASSDFHLYTQPATGCLVIGAGLSRSLGNAGQNSRLSKPRCAPPNSPTLCTVQ